MAKKAKTTKTRWVKYMGPYSRVSVPLRPNKYISRGEAVEVAADTVLCVHWRDAAAPSKSAPAKDGE